MTIIELKDCNILNIYNSYTDGYYDEFYYGCETCGGADVPDILTLTVVSDKFHDRQVSFFDDEAEIAIRNFLPWVLTNKDNFKDVSFYDFTTKKIPELALEETDE